MAKNKKDIINKIAKNYYLLITTDCIECSPKLEDALEIREAVIKALSKIKEVSK